MRRQRPPTSRNVAGVAPADDQLPQEQRVAAARSPQGERGPAVDRPAEGSLDQLGGRLDAEGRDVDAFQQLVLPETGHRRGEVDAGPDGDDQEDRARLGQQVHQRRAGVVELVRVVDDQQHPPVARPGQDRLRGLAERVGLPLRGGEGAGKMGGERPERDRRRSPVGTHQRAGPAPRPGQVERLGGQAGLADPGRAGEHHPGQVAVHHRGHGRELGGSPDERPGGGHGGRQCRAWAGGAPGPAPGGGPVAIP